MKKHTPPLLGFAAASGTGKTTLLTKLIPLLKKSGLRIGVIKHSHHNFEIDKPGKDSYQLRKAGASPIMLISNKRRAMITEFDDISIPRLKDQLTFFNTTNLN
jgi:molybdopterin-guanine dinucleotide biosynthesis protein B